MIFVQGDELKVSGTKIPGAVTRVTVTEEGTIEDKKDKKGKVVKANVPKGYQAAEVAIEMIFEESSKYTRDNMVRTVQQLFKAKGQKKQKKRRIVETQCASRGITEVYFNAFTTEEEVGKSYYTGTLSFVAPVIGSVKATAKKASKTVKDRKAKKKKAAKDAKKKTKKKTAAKSPAKDTKNTKSAKKKAKSLIKKR